MPAIFSWWNLIFLLPLLAAGLSFFVNAIKARRSISTKTHTSAGLHDGASLDLAHDFDPQMDLESDLDFDADQEQMIEQQETGSPGIFLEFLGAGKVNSSILFQIFFFSWGVSGWILNAVLQPLLRDPRIFVWISVAGSLLSSVLLTRVISRLIARFAPFLEAYAREQQPLIGCEGEAVYRITLESGMAQVYDEKGSLHRINCRIQPKGNIIHEGDRILIVGYDSGENLYRVK